MTNRDVALLGIDLGDLALANFVSAPVALASLGRGTGGLFLPFSGSVLSYPIDQFLDARFVFLDRFLGEPL